MHHLIRITFICLDSVSVHELFWKRANVSLATLMLKLNKLTVIFCPLKFSIAIIKCKSHVIVCEPTSIGFPIVFRPGFKNAAQNVQCIHTSAYLGTIVRDCHQDWNMGDCGISQVGGSERRVLAGGRPKEFFGNGSHGLCPVFYNIAFESSFPSIYKPLLCLPPRAATYVANFSMGYLDALSGR